MFDLLTSATWSSVIADPRFAAAVAIALLSGLVRGFSGFGSALLHIPLMSAVYSPQLAAPVFVLGDLVTGLLFLSGVWRKANWREIFPMFAAAVASAQLGTFVLQYANPVALRWALCILVAAVVVVLASGWRYRGPRSLGLTITIGLFAGLLGGAVQISGPPIIVYWMGSAIPPDILRANFFGYFSLFSVASVATHAAHGMMNAGVIVHAILATPMMIAGMATGTYLFRFASEQVYRWVGYVIIAASAIISMPLLDGIIR